MRKDIVSIVALVVALVALAAAIVDGPAAVAQQNAPVDDIYVEGGEYVVGERIRLYMSDRNDITLAAQSVPVAMYELYGGWVTSDPATTSVAELPTGAGRVVCGATCEVSVPAYDDPPYRWMIFVQPAAAPDINGVIYPSGLNFFGSAYVTTGTFAVDDVQYEYLASRNALRQDDDALAVTITRDY